jgi:putative hydrolase of the HAD superfamily
MIVRDAVLFDLGNTLARYYGRPEFPAILEEAIGATQNYLRDRGLLSVSNDVMWRRVSEEDYEAEDHRVRPLERRLARIFELDLDSTVDAGMAVCRAFMKPIFARGHRYEDALPSLRELRMRGLKTAVVSNAPWGSPGDLWREEMARLGLAAFMDVVVFCTDVGWRKPARQIFEFALGRLQSLPQDCVFVGDDPRWDLAGPRAMGMDAILIDRRGTTPDAGGESIRDLRKLLGRL